MKNTFLLSAGAFGITALIPALTTAPAPQRPNMEFQVESRFGFADTVSAIITEAPLHKFTVLHVHPMSETFASRGFPRAEAITIIEVCNAKLATTAINNDIRSGLMMPCPVMVYERAGKTFVMTYDTRVMSEMYEGGPSMKQVGSEVYKTMRTILNSVKK